MSLANTIHVVPRESPEAAEETTHADFTAHQCTYLLPEAICRTK